MAAATPASETIAEITFRDDRNDRIFFRMKKSTPLSRAFRAYASKKGMTVFGLRFLFYGTRVFGEETMNSLGIEDGDEIDVLKDMAGS